MKILIINKHFSEYLGGSESQCNIIASYLGSKNVKVIYLAYNGNLSDYNEPYIVLNSNLSILSFIKVLIKYNPDIIYWRNNFNGYLIALIISKFFKSKFVFAVSGPSDIGITSNISFRYLFQFDFRKFLGSLYNYTLSIVNLFAHNFVDQIIFQLSSQANFRKGLNSIIIPNSFEPSNIPIFSWPNKYVIWVSNVKNYKNPELFIKLASYYSNVDFLMVGDIQDFRYKYLVDNTMELPSNFYYLGKKSVDEVNSIIVSSEFLVHTCDPEGFPNVFLQAWAYGKCTLSLYYDPDNFISNNSLGLYSGNFDSLLIDFDILLNNNVLRNEFEKNAFNFYKSHFKTKNVVEILISNFNNLLNY